MRNPLIVAGLMLLGTSALVSQTLGAIPLAGSNWATDDIVTVVYDPAIGSLAIDNPAAEDAGAEAIVTLTLTASIPFFTGPMPFEKPLFDVFNPDKLFMLRGGGFFEASWPAGSVEAGIINADEVLTLSGSFLSGRPLEPADIHIVPEPSSLALLGLSAVGLVGLFRPA